MDNLRCVVERITYQNETNGYAVIKCRAKGFNELVTVVGNMPTGVTYRPRNIYGKKIMDREEK